MSVLLKDNYPLQGIDKLDTAINGKMEIHREICDGSFPTKFGHVFANIFERFQSKIYCFRFLRGVA